MRTAPTRIRIARSLLFGGAPAHQGGDEIAEALPAEDPADPFRDGKLDAEASREVAEDGRGRQSLDDLPDLAGRRFRSGPTCDQLTGLAVPAVPAPAGDDQVAHAGQARERLLAPSASLP